MPCPVLPAPARLLRLRAPSLWPRVSVFATCTASLTTHKPAVADRPARCNEARCPLPHVQYRLFHTSPQPLDPTCGSGSGQRYSDAWARSRWGVVQAGGARWRGGRDAEPQEGQGRQAQGLWLSGVLPAMLTAACTRPLCTCLWLGDWQLYACDVAAAAVAVANPGLLAMARGRE